MEHPISRDEKLIVFCGKHYSSVFFSDPTCSSQAKKLFLPHIILLWKSPPATTFWPFCHYWFWVVEFQWWYVSFLSTWLLTINIVNKPGYVLNMCWYGKICAVKLTGKRHACYPPVSFPCIVPIKLLLYERN